MTLLRFVAAGVKFRRNKIILLVFAVALSTGILSGALYLGDSVKQTILTLGQEKIGDSRYIVRSADPNRMLPRMEDDSGNDLVPLLKLPARCLINESGLSLETFNAFATGPEYFANYPENDEMSQIGEGEVVVNDYLADQLNLKAGDRLQLRCGVFSQLSPAFSFYENPSDLLIRDFTVKAVLPNRGPGRFSTAVDQGIEPLALFNLEEFQVLLGTGNKVNFYLAGKDWEQETLEDSIDAAWTLSDLGLRWERWDEEWGCLVSDQLFLSPELLSAVNRLVPRSSPVFAYFANAAEHAGSTSPFPFIVGIDEAFLKDRFSLSLSNAQACISRWLEEDLAIPEGDTFYLSYFVVDNAQKLNELGTELEVVVFQPEESFLPFRQLIPDFPGLSGKEDCQDWDPSIPIDLGLVRSKDEAYWNEWAETPKILIPYETAVDLWGSETAAATGLLIPAAVSLTELERTLPESLPFEAKGVFVEDYLSRISTAGGNSINFTELFLGLSFLLIIAAVFLLIFILEIFYGSRTDEIFILKASGFSRTKITRIYLGEVLVFTVPGIILGTVLGFLYNFLLMTGLRTIWYEAARLDTVLLSFSLKSLVIGAVSSLLINLGASFGVLHRIIGKTAVLRKSGKAVRKTDPFRGIVCCAGLLIVLFLLILFLHSQEILLSPVAFFFSSGGILLILFPLLAVIFIRLILTKRNRGFSRFRFSLKGLSYHSSRTLSLLFITSLSVFMIISIGANKLISTASDSESGTGRYEVSIRTAESLSPQRGDYAGAWGLPGSSVLPLRIKEGDEASCLNLNQVLNPRITALDPGIPQKEGRFRIVEEVQSGSGWSILDAQLGNRRIPALADQGVLRWSLGLSTGDSLEIRAEDGEVYTLVFMAALSASVFQGSVLISEENFLRLFPSSKGYNRFLVDFPDTGDFNAEAEMPRLERILRSFGPVVRSNPEILNEYYSVQNSYISIFFQLGLTALIFAVAGISVLLLRKIQEEKNDIAIQRIIGMQRKRIFLRLFAENFLTLVLGTAMGTISSIIALLPVFQEERSLLTGYPLLAFGVISVCSAVFLLFFISRGLAHFDRLKPDHADSSKF